jgi:hypothetical protein
MREAVPLLFVGSHGITFVKLRENLIFIGIYLSESDSPYDADDVTSTNMYLYQGL